MDHGDVSVPSTRYEIQNWLFGRGKVVEASGDGGGGEGGPRRWSKPQRHSTYFGLPLGEDGPEIARLKRQYRRTDSHRQTPRQPWMEQREGEEGRRLSDARRSTASRSLKQGAGLSTVDRQSRSRHGQSKSRQRRSRPSSAQTQTQTQTHRSRSHLETVRAKEKKAGKRQRDSGFSGDTMVGGTLSPSAPSSPMSKRFTSSRVSSPNPRPASTIPILQPTISPTTKFFHPPPPTSNFLLPTTPILNHHHHHHHRPPSTSPSLFESADTMEDHSKGCKEPDGKKLAKKATGKLPH